MRQTNHQRQDGGMTRPAEVPLTLVQLDVVLQVNVMKLNVLAWYLGLRCMPGSLPPELLSPLMFLNLILLIFSLDGAYEDE